MKKVLLAMAVMLSGITSLWAQNDSTLIVYFSRAGYNYDVGVRDESVTDYYVGWIDEGNTAVFARYIKEYTGYTKILQIERLLQDFYILYAL